MSCHLVRVDESDTKLRAWPTPKENPSSIITTFARARAIGLAEVAMESETEEKAIPSQS